MDCRRRNPSAECVACDLNCLKLSFLRINFVIPLADCKETSILNEHLCEFSTAMFRPKRERVCIGIQNFIQRKDWIDEVLERKIKTKASAWCRGFVVAS